MFFKMWWIVSRRVTWICSTISQIEYKSDDIYEGRVFDSQCCCLCICIFVGRASCVRSTMLLPLYLCWEGVVNIWRSCVPSTFLCIFVGSDWIYKGSLFDQRFSVSLSGPVFDPSSSLSLLGERLCIFVWRAWDCLRLNIWRLCVRSTLTATSTS